jgi:carbonic anhydrase
VKKAMGPNGDTVIDSWLQNIRDVQRLHFEELKVLDEDARYRRVVELNVREQCTNLLKTGVGMSSFFGMRGTLNTYKIAVQRSLRETGFPRIHGLVYELKDGLLKELDIGKGHEKYGSVYGAI